MRTRTRVMVAAALVAAVLCCGCADNGVGGAFGKQRYTVNKCGKDGTAADCKTVTIGVGGVEWMAENLNRKPSSGESWCYDNKEYNCDRFGRLYDWEAAQTVCPTGWHLATSEEWDSLGKAAGSNVCYSDDNCSAKARLKSTYGWYVDYGKDCGKDSYGFAALPGGYRVPGSAGYSGAGSSGNWWTATESNGGTAYSRRIESERWSSFGHDLDKNADDKANGYSVRCVTSGAINPGLVCADGEAWVTVYCYEDNCYGVGIHFKQNGEWLSYYNIDGAWYYAYDDDVGTWSVYGNTLMITINGVGESIMYRISGSTLTLTPLDGGEVATYTKTRGIYPQILR